jgi:hypothetical protein
MKIERQSNPLASLFRPPEKSPVPDTGPIEIRLVRTSFFTRWPCSVCLGYTEKEEVLAEGPGGLRVCETCLKRGDIDGHLEQSAVALEQEARNTRALIGRLKVPTFAEWQHAGDCCEAEARGCTVEEARADRIKREEKWLGAHLYHELNALGPDEKAHAFEKLSEAEMKAYEDYREARDKHAAERENEEPIPF